MQFNDRKGDKTGGDEEIECGFEPREMEQATDGWELYKKKK